MNLHWSENLLLQDVKNSRKEGGRMRLPENVNRPLGALSLLPIMLCHRRHSFLLNNMKSFDVYLRRAIRPEWQEYYVNYEFLKEKLGGFVKRRKALVQLLQGSSVHLTYQELSLAMASTTTTTSGAVNQSDYFQYQEDDETVDPEQALFRLSNTERSDFCELLESEISKAATFYSTQLVGLAKLVSTLNNGDNTTTVSDTANEILEVYCFVVVNLIALRQILIRYDAYCRTYDGVPLSEWYLQKRVWDGSISSDKEDYIEALFTLDALNHVEESFLVQAKSVDATFDSDDFSKQYQTFRTLLEKTFESVERAASGHIVFRDRFIVSHVIMVVVVVRWPLF